MALPGSPADLSERIRDALQQPLGGRHGGGTQICYVDQRENAIARRKKVIDIILICIIKMYNDVYTYY